MNETPIDIRLYQTDSKRCPFQEWLKSLDRTVKKRIDARLARLRQGNTGNCKAVGEGVFELKLDFGPGYRIYFGRTGKTIVILLCAGDKSTQKMDIKIAQTLWEDFLRRTEK